MPSPPSTRKSGSRARRSSGSSIRTRRQRPPLQAAGTAGMKLIERPASWPAVEIPALISTRKVTIFSCRLHLTGSQIAFSEVLRLTGVGARVKDQGQVFRKKQQESGRCKGSIYKLLQPRRRNRDRLPGRPKNLTFFTA